MVKITPPITPKIPLLIAPTLISPPTIKPTAIPASKRSINDIFKPDRMFDTIYNAITTIMPIIIGLHLITSLLILSSPNIYI